jgi:hypothetical protein
MVSARQSERFAIIERGRSNQESAVVLVENSSVYGWCFTEETIERFDQLDSIVPLKPGSATSDAIVQHAINELESGKAHFRRWYEETSS